MDYIRRIALSLLPKGIRKKAVINAKRRFRKIYVGKDPEEKAKRYVADKCLICLAFFVGTCVFAGIYAYKNGKSNVDVIKRPGENEAEKIVNLVADVDSEIESISIVISPVKKSREEAYKCIEEGYKKAVKLLLGENEDLSHVTNDLYFVPEIKEEDVSITYDSDNYDLISNTGEIVSLDNEGKCNVIMRVSCGDYEKEYKVPVIVVKCEKMDVEKYVQDYVDSQDGTNGMVSLPDIMDGKNLTYKYSKDIGIVFIIIIGFALSVSMFFIKDRDINEMMEMKEEEMAMDFPDILSKYSLIVGAGLSNVNALEKIVRDYEKSGEKRYAYEEIKQMLKEIKIGINEKDAYEKMGKRVGLSGFVKWAVLMQENLTRGNGNLIFELNKELRSASEERRRIMRIRGEKANTKLVFPMVMILAITLLIIIMPAFMGLKGGL